MQKSSKKFIYTCFNHQKDEEDFKVNNLVFASDFSDEIKVPFAKVIEFAKALIHISNW